MGCKVPPLQKEIRQYQGVKLGEVITQFTTIIKLAAE